MSTYNIPQFLTITDQLILNNKKGEERRREKGVFFLP